MGGLHRHLPRVVGRLQQADVPLDWGRLLVDLADWTRHHDRIAKRWLQGFYRRLTPAPDETAPSIDRPPAPGIGSEDT
jgi:hypothetical protein